MKIVVSFHMSHDRGFKKHYLIYVCHVYEEAFPNLLSYNRFLEVMPRVIVPMCAYFTSLKEKLTGIECIDSTSIKVCHNMRILRHKTSAGIAQRSKTLWAGFMVSCIQSRNA